jgi:hypothetical protein
VGLVPSFKVGKRTGKAAIVKEFKSLEPEEN